MAKLRARAVALLLESVFGLGMFATALVVSLGLTFIISKGTDGAREHSLAAQVGRQYLDDYLSRKFSDPLLAAGVTTFAAPVVYHVGVNSNAANAGDTILDLTVNVTIAVAAEYKDVLLPVSWNEGMPRQLFLEGCVGNY